MAIKFTHDIKDMEKLAKSLEVLHRSAFPVVVRETLNNTAFDMKKKELLPVANQNFTVRSPSFFRKFSKVEKATGFHVEQMEARTGMLDTPESENFHQQEVGGPIQRTTIPNDMARTSSNPMKRVRKANYLGNNKVVRGTPSRRRSKKSQLVADAAFAKRNDLLIKRGDTMFRVTSFRMTKKGPKMKLRPLYSVERGRSVDVKATRFIEEAAIRTLEKRAGRHFIVAANKQFKKYLKP